MNKIFTKINKKEILQKFIFSIFLCVIFFGASSVQAASLNKAQSNLSLAGRWPLNEGSGTVAGDVSGNGNNGTLNGISSPSTSTSGWNKGKYGYGLAFFNLSNYVQMSDANSLDTTSDVTLSAWIKLNATSDTQFIINKDENYSLRVTGGLLRMQFWTGTAVRAIDVTAPSANVWHHVVGVASGNEVTAVYVDGILQGSSPYTLSTGVSRVLTNPLLLGTGFGGGYAGMIDEAIVYTRALTATEVRSLYVFGARTKKTVTNNGLVAYWPFNDGYSAESPVVGDFSGNGNTATGVSFSATGISTSGSINGKLGKAFMFDGSNDHFIVNDSSSLNLMSTSTTTAAAWIYMTAYPEASTQWIHQIVGDETASCGSFIFRIGSQGSSSFNKRIGINFRTPTDHDTQNNTDLPLNTWTHIAVTTDGTNARFYINGLLDTTQAYTFTPQSTSCEWGIGWNSGVGRYFEGAMDDLRLYNRTLSATEIFNLSKMGAVTRKPPNNLGLVGYWPFSEGTGTSAGDASGNSNTGTLTSMSSPATSTSGWNSGKFGKGLTFDGSDDNVNLGSSLFSTSSGTAPLTMSAWVNTSYTAGYQSIFSQAIAGNAGRFTMYVVLSTGLVTYEKGGVVVLTSSKAVNDGKWHLVTATRNSSSTVTIYIDGVSQGTATDSVSFSSTNTLVGKDHNPNPFNGKIDEVRIYNRDLSASEVFNLYNYGR